MGDCDTKVFTPQNSICVTSLNILAPTRAYLLGFDSLILLRLEDMEGYHRLLDEKTGKQKP